MTLSYYLSISLKRKLFIAQHKIDVLIVLCDEGEPKLAQSELTLRYELDNRRSYP